MSEVHTIICDWCGKTVDADLTPPGWSFDGEDLCPSCRTKREGAIVRERERIKNEHGR